MKPLQEKEKWETTDHRCDLKVQPSLALSLAPEWDSGSET